MAWLVCDFELRQRCLFLLSHGRVYSEKILQIFWACMGPSLFQIQRRPYLYLCFVMLPCALDQLE